MTAWLPRHAVFVGPPGVGPPSATHVMGCDRVAVTRHRLEGVRLPAPIPSRAANAIAVHPSPLRARDFSSTRCHWASPALEVSLATAGMPRPGHSSPTRKNMCDRRSSAERRDPSGPGSTKARSRRLGQLVAPQTSADPRSGHQQKRVKNRGHRWSVRTSEDRALAACHTVDRAGRQVVFDAAVGRIVERFGRRGSRPAASPRFRSGAPDRHSPSTSRSNRNRSRFHEATGRDRPVHRRA